MERAGLLLVFEVPDALVVLVEALLVSGGGALQALDRGEGVAGDERE